TCPTTSSPGARPRSRHSSTQEASSASREEQSIRHTESWGSASWARSATMRAATRFPDPAPPARYAAPARARRSTTVSTAGPPWTLRGCGCYHRFENGPLFSGGDDWAAVAEGLVSIETVTALVSLLSGRFASAVISALYCVHAVRQNSSRSAAPQWTVEAVSTSRNAAVHVLRHSGSPRSVESRAAIRASFFAIARMRRVGIASAFSSWSRLARSKARSRHFHSVLRSLTGSRAGWSTAFAALAALEAVPRSTSREYSA